MTQFELVRQLARASVASPSNIMVSHALPMWYAVRVSQTQSSFKLYAHAE